MGFYIAFNSSDHTPTIRDGNPKLGRNSFSLQIAPRVLKLQRSHYIEESVINKVLLGPLCYSIVKKIKFESKKY